MSNPPTLTSTDIWPSLPLEAWQDTYAKSLAFYFYAYPEPDGLKQVVIRPDAAFYSKELGEFILPYEAVRQAESPDQTLLEFLQSTYETAASLGNWNQEALQQLTFKEISRKELTDS